MTPDTIFCVHGLPPGRLMTRFFELGVAVRQLKCCRGAKHLRTLVASVAISALGCAAVPAGAALALEMPQGPVVLKIVGRHLQHANSGADAVFDLGMLERLAGRSATVETPWMKGKVTFSGPFLRSVLAAAGANGQMLTVRALNDYSVEVPAEDAASLDTILAIKLNGKPMSVRDKGPLFLIYPFDLDSSLYNEKYFARSVWQIQKIEVAD